MQVCSLARAAGAKVLIDNAFLTPALLRPLALCTPPAEDGGGGEICGADVIIHSSTKFLSVRLAHAPGGPPALPNVLSTRVPNPSPANLVFVRRRSHRNTAGTHDCLFVCITLV